MLIPSLLSQPLLVLVLPVGQNSMARVTYASAALLRRISSDSTSYQAFTLSIHAAVISCHLSPYAAVRFSKSEEITIELRRKAENRLKVYRGASDRLPTELLSMILEYLPLELILLGMLLERPTISLCLSFLRRDPIAARLERASQVLRYSKRDPKTAHVELQTQMIAQFIEIAGHWYLQGLGPHAGPEQAGKRSVMFNHNRDRRPYIAIQVNEFGITHIAFERKRGKPIWISPNTFNKLVECFQDSGNDESYDTLFVVSDGLKICTVDIRQQPYTRARAILPIDVSAHYWSLSTSTLLYIRPTIIDLTEWAVYARIPQPGLPGFRLSSTPEPGLRKISFNSRGLPRTARLIHHGSSIPSFVRFDEEQSISTGDGSDAMLEALPNVVGFWQYASACNFIISGP
ncbi:hypothetical protein EJ07DRAFT_156463 [Lizonia empirigonia]|nr:hypothetical protein EJ07DRAFT_156463 [Lizonia empirigonia]